MLQKEFPRLTNSKLLQTYFRNSGRMTKEGFIDPGAHDRETTQCGLALLTLSERRSGALLLKSTHARFLEHRVDAFGKIRRPARIPITVRGRCIHVTRVRDPHRFWREIAGRADIQANEGVLFVPFESNVSALHLPFSMRDRDFPVDGVWLQGKTVTYVEKNIRPVTSERFLNFMQEKLAAFKGADRVLILKAGEADKRSIISGSHIL